MPNVQLEYMANELLPEWRLLGRNLNLLSAIVTYKEKKKGGEYLILCLFLLDKILSFPISFLTTCRILNFSS